MIPNARDLKPGDILQYDPVGIEYLFEVLKLQKNNIEVYYVRVPANESYALHHIATFPNAFLERYCTKISK